jgi:hypothetical protein
MRVKVVHQLSEDILTLIDDSAANSHETIASLCWCTAKASEAYRQPDKTPEEAIEAVAGMLRSSLKIVVKANETEAMAQASQPGVTKQ